MTLDNQTTSKNSDPTDSSEENKENIKLKGKMTGKRANSTITEERQINGIEKEIESPIRSPLDVGSGVDSPKEQLNRSNPTPVKEMVSNTKNSQPQSAQPTAPTTQNGTLKTVLHNLNIQRKKRTFTDVTIMVENEPYNLHRCLLAANSEYFTNLFNQGANTQQNSVYVLLNITKKSFEVLVDFIYTGGFTLNKENVFDVHQASKVLNINHVFMCCQKVIKEIEGTNGQISSDSNVQPQTLTQATTQSRGPSLSSPAITTPCNSVQNNSNLAGLANLATFLQQQTRHMSNSTINANLINNALPILANLNMGAGMGLPSLSNLASGAMTPTNGSTNNGSISHHGQNPNSLNNEANHRNLLSLQNSLLPVEVQQVFLNQLASGKLNQNVSKSLRKDAAFLAKQLEKQVQSSKSGEVKKSKEGSASSQGNNSEELLTSVSNRKDKGASELIDFASKDKEEAMETEISKIEENIISSPTNLSLQDQLAQLARTLAKQQNNSKDLNVTIPPLDIGSLLNQTIGQVEDDCQEVLSKKRKICKKEKGEEGEI